MEKNTIGLFLAALRKANGLTQRQLADKLCVSDKAISRWERDEALPDLTLIPVIAEIFGITSDELLRGQRSTESAPSSHNANKTGKQFQNIIKQALPQSHMWIVYTINILHHAIWCAGYIVAFSKLRRYYCINRPTE